MIGRALLLAVLGFAPGCALTGDTNKTFAYYNGTNQKLSVESMTGIYTYGKNDVHSALKNMTVWPHQSAQDKTWGRYIEVEYPVTVRWSYASGGSKNHTATLNSIDGIDGKPTKLRGVGTLALYFGADENWHLRWVPGNSHLIRSEFKSLANQH